MINQVCEKAKAEWVPNDDRKILFSDSKSKQVKSGTFYAELSVEDWEIDSDFRETVDNDCDLKSINNDSFIFLLSHVHLSGSINWVSASELSFQDTILGQDSKIMQISLDQETFLIFLNYITNISSDSLKWVQDDQVKSLCWEVDETSFKLSIYLIAQIVWNDLIITGIYNSWLITFQLNDVLNEALNRVIVTGPWKSCRWSDLQSEWNNFEILKWITAKLKQVQKNIKQKLVAADSSSDNKISVNSESQISIYDSFSFIWNGQSCWLAEELCDLYKAMELVDSVTTVVLKVEVRAY